MGTYQGNKRTCNWSENAQSDLKSGIDVHGLSSIKIVKKGAGKD